MNFNKLSLEEKFGQMILLGLDTYNINEEIITLIKEYKIGGIVLYKKNYTSLDSMVTLINKLKEYNADNIPLFITIDQENGRVNRLPKDVLRMYSALTQAKTNNLSLSLAVDDITSYILKLTGVNMNFAPVLDIVRSEKNKVIGNRSYGDSKKKVLEYALPYMKSLQKNNIVSVVKHFPSHGLANKDSHIFIPKIKDVKTLKNDIKVYEEAIKNGADAIMVGHLRVKGYGLLPATLNKKILDEMLIKKYNYDGLIITDDLRMNFIKGIYGIKRGIKKSINAGCTMFMLKYKSGDSRRIYKKLLKMVKLCEIDPEIINNNAKKIIQYKKKYKVNNDLLNPKINIDSINEKIKELNDMIVNESGEIR